MTPAEFEEKEFEGPLYNQLLFGHHHISTPGQVFEGIFGIDVALYAAHPMFWDFFMYPDIPQGCVLDHFKWGWVWRQRRHRNKRALPNFSTNLLIQSKRPYVLLRAGSTITSSGPAGPLWQFSIRAHQQPLLEKIATTLGHRALVVYASPAFDTFDSLYDHTANQTLVENCTYVKVERLKNHASWVYSGPGTQGVAQSEPENVEDVPFNKMIDELAAHYTPDSDAKENLHFISDVLTKICREMSQKTPLAEYMDRVSERLSESAMDMKLQGSHVYHFLHTTIMLHILGVNWMIVGK